MQAKQRMGGRGLKLVRCEERWTLEFVTLFCTQCLLCQKKYFRKRRLAAANTAELLVFMFFGRVILDKL